MLWTHWYQSLFPSPPGEHLAFSGIASMHRQILVGVEEVCGTHQHSNEEPYSAPLLIVPAVICLSSLAFSLLRYVHLHPTMMTVVVGSSR